MRKSFGILLVLLLAMCSAVAVLLLDVDLQTGTSTLLYIRGCLTSSPVNATLMAAACVLLLFLYRRFVFQHRSWQKREIFHGLVFVFPLSAVLAISPIYRQDDGALSLFMQPYHLLLLLCKLLGWIPLLFALYRELLIFIESLRFSKLFPAPGPASGHTARKRLQRFWLLLVLCWLPLWIARFPGVVTEDAGRALQQYFYEAVRTNDHPYFFTLLMGGVVQIGLWLGSGNLGVALFIALQIAFLSGVFAWSLRDMAKAGCSPAVQWTVFCLYAFLPVIASNVGIIIKDMLFSAAFVGYVLVLSRAVLSREKALADRRWWIAFLVFSCLVLLIRHNGKMVVWPMTAVLLIVFWKDAGLRKRLARTALILAPVLIAFAFQVFIEKPALIAVDSTADMLGVPLQQTARIIRDHEESVTPEDREAIGALYPYDDLARLYSPRISDPIRIKYRYFDSVSLNDKLGFLRTWAKLGARHPLTTFHAFWTMNGIYLDPTADGSVYTCTTLPANYYKYPAAVGSTQPEFLRGLRDRMFAVEAIWRALPLVSQLNNVGLYPWLLFLGFLLLGRTPWRRARLLYVPCLMILAGCLLAAGFYSCTRYAFPLVYGAPYLLAMTGTMLRKKKDAVIQ